MEVISRAECVELAEGSSSAVVVAEGLRSWRVSGRDLILCGPRLTAEAPALGRLRTVPDRLGAVNGAAETHAVVLAKNCRAEEMELTQRWFFSADAALVAELEFIVPPAWGDVGRLGVVVSFAGETPLFDVISENAAAAAESGATAFFLPDSPVAAGIYRMNLTFIAKK